MPDIRLTESRHGGGNAQRAPLALRRSIGGNVVLHEPMFAAHGNMGVVIDHRIRHSLDVRIPVTLLFVSDHAIS